MKASEALEKDIIILNALLTERKGTNNEEKS